MDNLSDYQKLNPLERGELFKKVKEDENLSYKELADKVDKSTSYIANSVRLTDLPVAIKDGLLGGVISEGHARALASLDNPSDCISIYKEVLRTHATVRETEDLVRQKKRRERKKHEVNKDQAEEIKNFLEKLLGVEVGRIETESSSRKIDLTIFFNSN